VGKIVEKNEGISATEMLNRIQNAIKDAESHINAANERVSVLSQKIKELHIENAVVGNRDDEIKKISAEIESLVDTIAKQRELIEVLTGELPDIEKKASVEKVINEDLPEYQQAMNDLQCILLEMPNLDNLTAEIERLEVYSVKLRSAKETFLRKGKYLYDCKLDDIDSKKLIEDRASFDYAGIIEMADSIIDLIERLNKVQYGLFDAATLNPVDTAITMVDPDTIAETSPSGRFQRVKKDGVWELKEKAIDAFANEYWHRIYSGREKPDFPDSRIVEA
jgi:hypothetical protein